MLLLTAASAVAMPMLGGAGGQVMHARAGKATVPQLSMDDVKQAIGDKREYDDMCLAFRVNACDVFMFYDEDSRLRHILIRHSGRGGDAKRHLVAAKVMEGLKTALGPSAPPKYLQSVDGTLLMYSEPSMKYSRFELCGADRCRAIDALLSLADEAELTLLKSEKMCVTIALKYEEGLVPVVTLDLTRPVVEYVELRPSEKTSRKKMKAKFLSLFEDIKQYKPEKRYEQFGSGEQAVETWWTDGTYYLTGNKRLYLVGTSKTLNRAMDAGVTYKDSAVELPDLSKYEVELPEKKIEPQSIEPEEETDIDWGETEPMTPEEARKAYIEILEDMFEDM
jgi:hypothetical protein